MENQKRCINCVKDYVSTEFLEIENEVEVNGEGTIRKDLICVGCCYGT